MRGTLSGKDFKFAPGKSYVVTSALAFEETQQLTLWQQVGDNSMPWGQTLQMYEQNKSKIEWGDTAWMLDTFEIRARFRTQADSNELGAQHRGDKKKYGEGYPPVLAHWKNALALQGARPTRPSQFPSVANQVCYGRKGLPHI